MADSPVSPAQPSSTANPTYPGVGIKRPQSLTSARRAKKMTKVRKPKKQYGGNGESASGNFASGGPGGSLGVAL